MKARVTDRGITVPRHMLRGAEEVEIRKEDGRVIIEPVPAETAAEDDDALAGLGRNPVACGAPDASEHHDDYLYGQADE